jgi:hypothetical protein
MECTEAHGRRDGAQRLPSVIVRPLDARSPRMRRSMPQRCGDWSVRPLTACGATAPDNQFAVGVLSASIAFGAAGHQAPAGLAAARTRPDRSA